MMIDIHVANAVAYVESGTLTDLSGSYVINNRKCLTPGPSTELGIHQITKPAYTDVVRSKYYKGYMKAGGDGGSYYTLVNAKYSLTIFTIYCTILKDRWGDKWLAHYNPGDKYYERKVMRAMFTTERLWNELWNKSMADGKEHRPR